MKKKPYIIKQECGCKYNGRWTFCKVALRLFDAYMRNMTIENREIYSEHFN